MTAGRTRPYIPDGAVLTAFMRDAPMDPETRVQVRGIVGPWGSGKSVCSIQTLASMAVRQNRDPADGVRRSRFAIIRETLVEMRSTTMNTYFDWIPKAAGAWRDSGPPRHLVRFGDGMGGAAEMEVLWLAMDNPSDVAQLDSLELTAAWVNEARHIEWENIRNLVGRCDRYPAVANGGSAFGKCVLMDTNPPPMNHWWYRKFEKERPDGWHIFRQPSGRSALAENTRWLPRGYYAGLCVGQDAEWIKVYVDGQYGHTKDGKPIYPDFNLATMVSPRDLEPIDGLPLLIGVDAGLTPAAEFFQRPANGQWRGLDELAEEVVGFGAKRFGEALAARVDQRFPEIREIEIWADPSSEYGADKEGGEKNWLEGVAAHCGLPIRAAQTNELDTRIDAVKNVLHRSIDGVQPGLLLSPRQSVLVDGFVAEYHYRRLQVSGVEYSPKPDKNAASHPHDATQYVFLGGGEYAIAMGHGVRKRRRKHGGPRRRYAEGGAERVDVG